MNGSFLRYVASIVAGLTLLAVAGSVLFDRQLASQVATNASELEAIRGTIRKYQEDIRKTGSFNRDDADREFHQRDVAIEKLERRVEQLERK